MKDDADRDLRPPIVPHHRPPRPSLTPRQHEASLSVWGGPGWQVVAIHEGTPPVPVAATGALVVSRGAARARTAPRPPAANRDRKSRSARDVATGAYRRGVAVGAAVGGIVTAAALQASTRAFAVGLALVSVGALFWRRTLSWHI